MQELSLAHHNAVGNDRSSVFSSLSIADMELPEFATFDTNVHKVYHYIIGCHNTVFQHFLLNSMNCDQFIYILNLLVACLVS